MNEEQHSKLCGINKILKRPPYKSNLSNQTHFDSIMECMTENNRRYSDQDWSQNTS